MEKVNGKFLSHVILNPNLFQDDSSHDCCHKHYFIYCLKGVPKMAFLFISNIGGGGKIQPPWKPSHM